jgi:mannose-6-phosphate isomerase-like protein (cupin superfamily)
MYYKEDIKKVAEKKYSKYVIKAPVDQSPIHPHLPLNLRFREKYIPWDDQKNINFGMTLHSVQKPMRMLTECHKHADFDQFLFFLGGDVKNVTDFDAEIEMCLGLGEEQEKYVITEPTVVRVPAGVYHGPLDYKRIGKPVTFISVFLAPEYKRIFPGD